MLFGFVRYGGDMKLILNIGGFAVIYLGANSLEIGDYVNVMAGALCVYVSGVLSS